MKRLILKSLAMLAAPFLRLLVFTYQVITVIFYYGLLGLIFVCLLGAGAEIFTIGLTREAIAYLVLAFGTVCIRSLVIFLTPILTQFKDSVVAYAAAPIRHHSE